MFVAIIYLKIFRKEFEENEKLQIVRIAKCFKYLIRDK